jgi:hypothetical protein
MTPRKPSARAPHGLAVAANGPARADALTTPQVRSDETIGRPEDVGRLVPDPGARRPRAEKPVRTTLDLDQEQHQFLRQTALTMQTEAAKILRALLAELADDPQLATRVRDRIWRQT